MHGCTYTINTMIPLLVVHDTAFVFDLDHVQALRRLGIVGVLVGTLPKAPQQNVFLGLPLQLSAYEAIWLVHHGHAVLVDAELYHRAAPPTQNTLQLRDAAQYAVTPDTVEMAVADAMVVPPRRFVERQGAERSFGAHYAAFSLLRERGYVLMPGLRFGGVFVAYPGDPLQFHSHLVVRTVAPGERVRLLELVGSGRLATAVKKAWVLAEAPRAFSIEWAGFG